ncbi:MAG: lysylphosphatidylglycerol synthase transmembrane domain-containing protein [Peptostreptococcaceae bacterium]
MRKFTKKEKVFIQYGFLILLISLTTYLVSTTLDLNLIPKLINIVNTKYILLGFILMIIYVGLESLVIRIIVKSIHKNCVKFIGFKLATMGMYYNLVTPFASGSQPMQIYALTKYDIKISKSIAIITNKTLVFQSIVTIYCGVLLLGNVALLKAEMPSVMMLVTIGMIMNVSMLLGGLLIVLSPKNVKRMLAILVKVLKKINLFTSLIPNESYLNKYIDEYNYSITTFIKNKKALISSVIFTTIQLTVFFSLVYCVYKAFNLNQVSYIKLLSLQVILYMSISPIPTPGNVGASELAFLTIFRGIFPRELIGFSVFLYSGYVYYFVIIITGILTIYTHYSLSKIEKVKVKL